MSHAQDKLNKEIYQLNVFEEVKKTLFAGDDFMSVNLGAMRSSSEYLIQINNQIVRQKNKILFAEKEVNEKRPILMTANQEKKSVELLKENQQKAYKKEANRTARIIEDEVASRIIQNNRL